jgi:hypothetical protein
MFNFWQKKPKEGSEAQKPQVAFEPQPVTEEPPAQELAEPIIEESKPEPTTKPATPVRKLIYNIGELDKVKKQMLIEFFGQYKTINEINETFRSLYNISLSGRQLIHFKERNAKEISQARNNYLAEARDIPIAIEKVRLERDELLYQLSQTLKDNKDKIHYGLSCIKEAREEAKGQNTSFTFNQYNQTNILSDPELLQKVREAEERVVMLSQKEKEVYVPE